MEIIKQAGRLNDLAGDTLVAAVDVAAQGHPLAAARATLETALNLGKFYLLMAPAELLRRCGVALLVVLLLAWQLATVVGLYTAASVVLSIAWVLEAFVRLHAACSRRLDKRGAV